ncbi:MAG: MliC family protein [Colwellia sp.]
MNFILKRFSTIIVPLLLIACTHSENLPSTQSYNEISYVCERGKPVLVRYYKNEELAVLIREEQTIELHQEPTASGFLYSNMKVSIRGKGSNISIGFGRMVPMSCQEK